MKCIGIDYGSKNVGIAVGDSEHGLAFPKAVLANSSRLLAEIKEIVTQEGAGKIILGESQDFKGVDNPIMKKILSFKKDLEDDLKIPVILHPEFMTSAEAERLQGKNDMIDASAAALILKSFFDNKKNEIVKSEKPEVTFDDFSKIQIKVGEILSVEKVPATDKLLKLSVNFNEASPRQIISGIALHFSDPAVLVGQKCFFVTNLQSRTIRGYESNGMLFAVGGKDDIPFSLIKAGPEIPPGTPAN